ncbi:hexamerin [Halyomorpha halys]|uniref:hexamerin n=1 Tax=Halyomorpha halys TaxID=286706 RepID=UPI0006D5162F|nr:hexamerin [Halyomorpha halys]
MFSLLTLLLTATAISATVVQQRPDRRIADATFLKQQKQILDLFVGIGHSDHWKGDEGDFDISANFGSFTDEKYPKEFLRAYKRGLLPKHGVFSMYCHHTKADAIRLFDLFYFAKDFETFIKVAGWAKHHIHAGMFSYAYILALTHRSDTQNFLIPPQYEIFPNFFVPSDTLHEVYDAKMEGLREGKFTYNNTGYEYNYHTAMFGGLMSSENRGYGDFRISYFREDVGLNNYLSEVTFRNPQWMSSEKYNTPWLKRRGENYYQILQQLFARYSQERTAHGLPNAGHLVWDQPIRVGYNPRVTFMNGQPMYNRPDGLIPEQFNRRAVVRAQTLERRILDAIDNGFLWEASNKSLIPLNNEDGFDLLGKIVFGTADRPSKNFFQSPYYAALEALSFISSTASDRSYVGNALSSPITASRDPVYFNYLARMITMFFQHYKRLQAPYSHGELGFNGVSVQKVEVDKLMTYFDMFDYEITNGVPVPKASDYTDFRYYARQYRLNHKPYHYNVTVNSEHAVDGIVRVFLGHKYDADEHLLTVNQARMTFVEIDRFIVKLAAGVNLIERSSKESPIFTSDRDGFRNLYTSVNNAINQKTPFYISEYGHCGLPERLQLPMGWRGGRHVQLAVAINSYDRNSAQPGNNNFDIACGGAALYDGRPLGFPFDRPLAHDDFHLPNIYFKDVTIDHREQTEVNRPAAS